MKDTPYRDDEETPEDTQALRSDPEEPLQQTIDSDVGEAVEGDGGDVTASWSPPSDPVVEPDARGNAQIVGGFAADSMDDGPADAGAAPGPGDEAIADAVRRELREDAATTELDVRVDVDDGIVRLTGRVRELMDAENAEAVAGRVHGVTEVIDEITVPGLEGR